MYYIFCCLFVLSLCRFHFNDKLIFCCTRLSIESMINCMLIISSYYGTADNLTRDIIEISDSCLNIYSCVRTRIAHSSNLFIPLEWKH